MVGSEGLGLGRGEGSEVSYILSIDQGTTGSTVMLFDEQGQPVAKGYQEFPQYFPQGGWVEHDPDEIWESVVKAASLALASADIDAKDIAAIGITNQRETLVAWDRKTGEPLTNAIVWQCRRTAQYCDSLREQGLEPVVREKTGLILDPYFSGTKMHWLLENVPSVGVAARTGRLCFGTVDSWLIWKLTGGAVHATDVSNASRTLVYNIHTLQWDKDLMDVFGVDASSLPEVRASAGEFGKTAGSCLFPAGIPVTGVAGDQQSALFGQACFDPGMTKSTYGTGAFLLMNTGDKAACQTRGLLTTIAWALGDQRPEYAVEGSIFIAGAAVQWLRDGLGLIKSAAESEELASAVPDAGGTYLVPAFTGLGAPYWDPYARGVFAGISRGTTRNHLVRAVLESIAFQTRDVVDLMVAETGISVDAVRIDGGAAANNFLAQFLADILGVPVDRPAVIETTALGAAYLAGIGCGLWTKEGLVSHRRIDRCFTPQMDNSERERLYRGWKKAVALSRGWAR